MPKVLAQLGSCAEMRPLSAERVGGEDFIPPDREGGQIYVFGKLLEQVRPMVMQSTCCCVRVVSSKSTRASSDFI